MKSRSRNRLFVALVVVLAASVVHAGAAFAQSCVGDTCDLGGQQRAQIGSGLPIPISLAPAPSGPLTSQPGAIGAISGATIMQTTAMAHTPSSPRALTLAPGQFTYNASQVGLPVFLANSAVFSVRTDLSIVNPHPSFGSVMLSAGGRPGPATVTWCPGSPAPTASLNPGCLAPDETALGGAPDSNGLARYTATRNQFGGVSRGRTIGTAMVYINVVPVTPGQLPCTTGPPTCVIGISQATPATTSVFGANFGVTNANPGDVVEIHAANIGAFGTVMSIGTPVLGVVTDGLGNPVGNNATSWGLPLTTGMLTISVTANKGGPPVGPPETFTRTGADGRNANGSGQVMLVSGTISDRTLSLPNANRGWLTLKIPEPGVLSAGSAAMLMLAGCHWLVRRKAKS